MADLTDADKQYRHSHSQHLRDEDHLRIARHVAKAVTDAELDRLVEQLGAIIPLLDGLETGQDCADYAFAKSNGFQAMTYCPDAFEALRSVPEAAAAITALRARIAEDQAQIAALTTYKENLRDEVIELRARIAELEAAQQQAIKQVCELAREAGEAKGKLEASELPGIVDGWREKCERLERRVAELEKERSQG